MKAWKRTVVIISLLLATSLVAAQRDASLRTRDIELRLAATPEGPRVLSLRAPGQNWWENQSPEPLAATAEVDGETIPITWTWNPGATQVRPESVSYVYESALPRLRLTWTWEARAARGPIEHVIRIENLDSREVWISLQNSFVFDWKIPPLDKLEHFYVEKGADTPSAFGTHRAPIAEGYRWDGLSSTYAHPKPGETREIIPWFLVERTETSSGWYVGLEFSGRTRLSLTREGSSLHGAVGLNPDPGLFRSRLAPGETFKTPVVFLGGFTGGIDSASNLLRRWVSAVLMNPKDWENPHYPLTVNNSWGGGMVINEEIAKRMIRDSAELGLEMFHVDAGWFRGVGDWYPNPEKFPHGLTAIADEAHQHGLKFGLWVDWTQAGLDTAPGALNARDPKVQNWLVNDLPPNWKPEEFKGQTIDLGVPEAKQWAEAEVERIVSDYHLDMLEHDGYLLAQGCIRTNHPHAPPAANHCVYHDSGADFVESSNSTDVSYHSVRAYYDIYTKLRRDHPELLLEVCNDGGRMVDFGSAAHADYFSITDTYDPLSNRRAFYDTSWVLPPPMLESYVERWPTPRIENFRYMLRSGMMGWFTIMLDTTSWTAEQHNTAKEEIQMYKTGLRPLIRNANLYHVSERPDGVHWDGMEYFSPELGRGVVYVFRGSTATESAHTFFLRGLNRGATYHLRFHDHSAPDRVARGADLMRRGLKVPLKYPNSSEIVFLLEEPAAARLIKGTKRGDKRK